LAIRFLFLWEQNIGSRLPIMMSQSPLWTAYKTNILPRWGFSDFWAIIFYQYLVPLGPRNPNIILRPITGYYFLDSPHSFALLLPSSAFLFRPGWKGPGGAGGGMEVKRTPEQPEMAA
jgi:hypothetical protein